jgi:pimeloyl-ACP methyl ester carboxylesterase
VRAPALRLAAVVTLLLAAGCGGGGVHDAAPPAPAPAVTWETLGTGAQAVTVARPGEARGALPVVLFLHGWGATDTGFYRPWIEHLVRGGNAVIYPRYQASVVDLPAQILGNVLVAMRRALAAVRIRPGSLVVAGHSAGGALAVDYAAVAAAVGLPVPRAVFAAYPGRVFSGIPFALPAVDPARIPAATSLLVLTSPDDRVVGEATARAITAGATAIPAAHRRLVVVRDAAVADHLGPQRADEAARRTFWARLDALIARARAT